MSGTKKKKKMAKKTYRTWVNPGTDSGEKNEEKSLTMPDMHVDPRVVIENHVRGINPITGAVLDRQRYYGDAILPYSKDLTYEELLMQRQALEQQAAELQNKLTSEPAAETNQPADAGTTSVESEGTGTGTPV
jgi:hypothetical protein